jgi:hypothetical protein
MATQGNLATEIDVKQAVQRAKDFAAELFKPEKISRLGLEAVERTDDGRYWLVTLGFTRPALYARTGGPSPLDQVLPRTEPREYKIFRVDASSGEVVSVDIFNS